MKQVSERDWKHQHLERPPQFQLRQAWIVVTVLAVALAIGAPYLRGLSEQVWQRLAMVCLSAGFGALVGWLLVWLNRRPPSQVGRLLCRASLSKPSRIPDIASYVLLVVYLAGAITHAVTESRGERPYGMAFGAGFFAWLPALVRAGSTVWIGDHGVFFQKRFHPWETVKARPGATDVRLLLNIHRTQSEIVCDSEDDAQTVLERAGLRDNITSNQ